MMYVRKREGESDDQGVGVYVMDHETVADQQAKEGFGFSLGIS